MILIRALFFLPSHLVVVSGWSVHLRSSFHPMVSWSQTSVPGCPDCSECECNVCQPGLSLSVYRPSPCNLPLTCSITIQFLQKGVVIFVRKPTKKPNQKPPKRSISPCFRILRWTTSGNQPTNLLQLLPKQPQTFPLQKTNKNCGTHKTSGRVIWVFPLMVVPPKHPKMIIFSRKTPGCWVPPF